MDMTVWAVNDNDGGMAKESSCGIAAVYSNHNIYNDMHNDDYFLIIQESKSKYYDT
jgi:hypothetical protein